MHNKTIEQFAEYLNVTSHEIIFFITKILKKKLTNLSNDDNSFNLVKNKYEIEKADKKAYLEKKINEWIKSNQKSIENDILICDSRKVTYFKFDGNYHFFDCLKKIAQKNEEDEKKLSYENKKGYTVNSIINQNRNTHIIKLIGSKIKEHFNLSDPFNRWEYANRIINHLKVKDKDWIEKNKKFVTDVSKASRYIPEIKFLIQSSASTEKTAYKVMEAYKDQIWLQGTERLLVFYEFLKDFSIKYQFFVTWDIFFESDENDIPKKLAVNFKDHFYPFKCHNHKIYKAFRDVLSRQNNKYFAKYKLIYRPKSPTDRNSTSRYYYISQSNVDVRSKDIDIDTIKNIYITQSEIQRVKKDLKTKSEKLSFSFLFWKRIYEHYGQNIAVSLKDLTVGYEIIILKDRSYQQHASINDKENILGVFGKNKPILKKEGIKRKLIDEDKLKYILDPSISNSQNFIEEQIDKNIKEREIREKVNNLLDSLNEYGTRHGGDSILFIYLYLCLHGIEFKPNISKLGEITKIRNPNHTKNYLITLIKSFYEDTIDSLSIAAKILFDHLEKECLKRYTKKQLLQFKDTCVKGKKNSKKT